MASSLIIRIAVAVIAAPVMLHFLGIGPPVPGLNFLLPRLGAIGATGGDGGSGGPGTINVQKLLADLNSDLLPPQGGHGDGEADGGVPGEVGAARLHEAHERAASAALSVMYLAAVPALRDQARRAPGVVRALLRHVLSTELSAAKQEHAALEQRQHQQLRRRRHHQRQQGAARGAQAGQDGPELLPACLLALAKLAAGDAALQAALLGLGGGGGVGGGGAGGRALREGQLLARLEELLHSDVPSWQAAAAVLLHTLAEEARPQRAVLAWVEARADPLLDVGMALVESGASYNSSDAVQAGMQLLELLAGSADGRARLADSGAAAVVYQVVVTYAGANSSSNVMGSAARLLRQLNAGGGPAAGGSGSGSGSGSGLPMTGLIAPLVREVRLGQRPSLAPSLALLADLVVARGAGGGGGGDGAGGAAGGAAEADAVESAGREAVGAGLLSICAQLLFKAGSDADARPHCSTTLRHIVARRRAWPADAPPQAPQAPQAPAASAPPFTPRRRHSALGRGRSDDADPDRDAAPGPGEADEEADGGEARLDEPYPDTPGGRAELASDLLRIMRETEFPDLHNSVLEACRDVAPARLAAEALVGAGVVPHMVAILAYNTTQGYELGLDGADTAWVLQSQRSAAAVVALLALQPRLRPQLVSDGALLGLGLALRTHSGQPGLMAQVRITAAAALVPLLGEDGRYNQAAVTAGVLEPVVRMYYARSEQERQVATRVLRLLGRETSVAAMYDRAGIKV